MDSLSPRTTGHSAVRRHCLGPVLLGVGIGLDFIIDSLMAKPNVLIDDN